ncbi:translation initiation factor 2 [Solibacillus sp. R5-41]|uniref:translation initiation factor 2 n=1 Tax=Solibacillus sp. R5-41 TaxID=2048654 RepID=UPI0020A4CC1E|nr:translation initiation factor 2 [Solibacillus sp. R5-41]
MDNNESQEIFIAQLSYIGAAISTLGDGIQAIAAGLTLESLKNANNQSSENSTDQSQKTESMQKQIDFLISELKQIKKILK